ncbi:MAG: PilN domain-containing protein [Culicoidibacterales bacterium]
MMQDINFFDHYQKQEQENRKLKPIAFVIIAVMLMAVLSSVLVYQAWQLSTEITELEITLNNPEIQEQLAETQQLAQELTILNQLNTEVATAISAINQKDANVTQYLLEISKIMPKTIILDQLTLNASVVTINAQAVTRQEIAEFQYNLKALGVFSDVYISTIQPTSGDGTAFNFQVQCQIGGGVNEN